MQCLNCSFSVAEHDLFCSKCGQKTSVHRFQITHLFEEFVHAFTHADKSIFSLIKQLATKPGIVLREYIVEGRRKKYFNPFTFLILVLGFTVFMNTLVRPFDETRTLNPKILESIQDPIKKQQVLKLYEKQQKMVNFFETKTNWVTFMSTPIISFMFWLFFRRYNLNFAENLVAYIFLIAFIMLFSAVTLTPLMGYAKGTPWYMWMVLLSLLVQIAYFSLAYKQFLNLNRSKTIRAVIASFCGILLWSLLSVAVIFIYLRN